MKGSVRKKRKNAWSYRIDLGTVDGKRKQVEKGGFKTEREATKAMQDVLYHLNNTGDYVENKKISFHTVYEEFKTEGGLKILAQEYHAFLDAYAAAPNIMRFRISGYNTHRIGVVLDGLPYPERHFNAQPDFLRQCKMFITQDEIDHHFLNEGTESRLHQ